MPENGVARALAEKDNAVQGRNQKPFWGTRTSRALQVIGSA